MAVIDKTARLGATGPSASWARTMNPFSIFMENPNIRVPKFMINMFGNTEAGHQLAALTANAAGSAATTLLAVGLLRGAQHVARMADLETSNDPTKGLDTQLGTTYALNEQGNRSNKVLVSNLQKSASMHKAADEPPVVVDNMGTWSSQNILGSPLPFAAVLAAGALGYIGMDKLFDKLENEKLTENISDKSRRLTELIKLRARLGKGNATAEEADRLVRQTMRPDSFVKQAEQKGWLGLSYNNSDEMTSGNSVVGAMGILLAALGVASGIGAYMWTTANDESNLKYKAYKKALQAHALNKASLTPITMVTPRDELFNEIDASNGAAPAQAPAAPHAEEPTPREQPAINTDDLSKPISVTL